MTVSQKRSIHWSLVLLHTLFWAVYLYFVFTLFLSNDIRTLELRTRPRVAMFCMRVFWDFTCFYLLYGFGIPRLLAKGKTGYFIFMAVGLLVLATVTRTQFELWWITLNKANNPVVDSEIPFWTQYMIRGLSSLFVIAMAGLGRFTFDWFRQQKERKELESQRLSSELAYLKSQVNPHFLFNTLNNIYGLARKQSPDTEDAILKLSGMMRYMLYETNVEVVPLSREVQQLQDYLSLQSLRYKQEGVATLSVVGDIERVQITPLLLVPLVENGFKHGRFSQPGDCLRLSLQVEDNELIFQTENPIAPKTEQKDAVGGVGLDNIRRRLDILYPERHSLTTEEEDGIFRATLMVQWA
ncbi:MAG: histidine kinase [Bacteroidota bacterium]